MNSQFNLNLEQSELTAERCVLGKTPCTSEEVVDHGGLEMIDYLRGVGPWW